MHVAQELAKRIHAFRYEDLPEEAVFWAKQAIMDTVGVNDVETGGRILKGTRIRSPKCLVDSGRRSTGIFSESSWFRPIGPLRMASASSQIRFVSSGKGCPVS